MVERHKSSAANLHRIHDSHSYSLLFDMVLVVPRAQPLVVPDKNSANFHPNHYSHRLYPSLLVMEVFDKNSANLHRNPDSRKSYLFSQPLAMVAPDRNSVSSRPNHDSHKLASEALRRM